MSKPRKYGSTCFLTFLRKLKETNMNKLIILSAFFLVSCANNQYKRQSLATVKYTVREYYLPVASKPETKPQVNPTLKTEVKPIKSAKKSSKSVKKEASRLDCGRVFKEINQCMKQ